MTEARDSHPLSVCASTGLPQPQSHDCLPLQGANGEQVSDPSAKERGLTCNNHPTQSSALEQVSKYASA